MCGVSPIFFWLLGMSTMPFVTNWPCEHTPLQIFEEVESESIFIFACLSLPRSFIHLYKSALYSRVLWRQAFYQYPLCSRKSCSIKLLFLQTAGRVIKGPFSLSVFTVFLFQSVASRFSPLEGVSEARCRKNVKKILLYRVIFLVFRPNADHLRVQPFEGRVRHDDVPPKSPHKSLRTGRMPERGVSTADGLVRGD